MWTFDRLRRVQLRVPLAIVAGLLVSVAFGLLIGGASFSTLKRLGILVLLIVYALFWQPHTWKIALAICLFGLTHVGFGFRISTVELSGMVALLLVAMTWWRKNRVMRAPVMGLFCFRIFNLALLGWLVYSLGHAVYTVMDPFRTYDFALKNFLKTVVGMTGPPALLFYFIHRPRGIVANREMLHSVVIISFLALVANILIRIWGMIHGMYNIEIAASLSDEAGYFTIPELDLTEDPYALRTMTPFTATVCAVLIGSRWLKEKPALFRAVNFLGLALSFIGAVLSGGRATVLFVFALTAAALWLRGHYRVVLSALAAGGLVVLSLNLVPGILQIVPPMLQRSLQIVVFTEESEFARLSISDSSRWRWELFQRALAEWRSDRRIFWFGRGTYKFGMEDVIAAKLNVAQGAMETSLRRGATHSLITDLLVVYGICGAVVYFFFLASLLWFLWRAYHHPSLDDVAKISARVSLLFLSFNTVYGLLGGAVFPIAEAWFLIAFFGYLYHLASPAKSARSPFPTPNRKLAMVPAEPRSVPSGAFKTRHLAAAARDGKNGPMRRKRAGF